MKEETKTYSITLRVRRVTYEDAYVAVPVTDAIMDRNADGSGSINYEAFVAAAIRISENEAVEWKVEAAHTEPNPIQCPVPDDRRLFDAHYSGDRT